ncbi:glycosyltransferase family 4 protein [Providencia rettgeri]
MSTKKKILIITPRFPYPVIGGDRLRIYEVCKELAKFYSLTLISLCEYKSELNMSIPNDNVFTEVHRVFLPKWKSFFNTAIFFLTKTPLQVSYYKSRRLQKIINQRVDEYDLVIPHLIRVAEFVKNIKTHKIIEMTDAISMNYSRVSKIKNKSGLKGLIFKIENRRLKSYEKQIAKHFNYTILVSQYDKDFLFKEEKDLYDRSLVCSNGVDLSKLPYQYNPGGYKLIFIGNMLSIQNLDAVYWFAEKVMPLLLIHGPYEFHVIGRISQDNIKKLSKYKNIVVTGAVDNIVDFTKDSLAGICSVRLAAGVQNKILEYMALGIPVIATSTGLEGLHATPDKEILVANTPEIYVEKILLLHNNHQFSKKISENGYVYVKGQHSWSNKLKPLCEKIHQLLS